MFTLFEESARKEITANLLAYEHMFNKNLLSYLKMVLLDALQEFALTSGHP